MAKITENDWNELRQQFHTEIVREEQPSNQSQSAGAPIRTVLWKIAGGVFDGYYLRESFCADDIKTYDLIMPEET